MRRIKKIASLLLAMVMVFAMSVTAFATEPSSNAETGSITIKETTNVPVAGKTFRAYKILDLKYTDTTPKGYVYTVPSGLESSYAQLVEVDINAGDFSAQVVKAIEGKNETELFEFATAILDKVVAKGEEPAKVTPIEKTGTANAKEVVFDNLALGYYVISDATEVTNSPTEGAEKAISALILQTAEPNVNVTVKADAPSLDKKIVEGTDRVVNNNVAVGDTVAFEVTSKVPDMTGYKSYFFVVNDTMSKGLTFDSESVVIRIGDKNSEPLTKDADYELTSTVNEDKTTSIEIVFKNFIQYKDQKGADITISYNAELNENAIIGTEGNPNTANLIYNNDPNKTWDMEDEDKPKPNQPTGKTPDKTTRTFVTGIELTKVDPAGKRLVGAEFTIKGEALNKILVRKDVFKEAADGEYWKLTDGSYTTDDPNGENMDQDKYDDVEKKYKKEVVTEVQTVPAGEVSAKAVVGEDGVVRFEGLSEGTYEITEVKAPDGYNLLEKAMTVKIEWTAPTTEEGGCTWTFTKDQNAPSTADIFNIEVENKAGSLLPSTGGIGTTIFYVVGGILVIGAGILLVTKRRMKAQ